MAPVRSDAGPLDARQPHAILPMIREGTAMSMLTALGVISGTSMDAIDVALLKTDGENRIEAGAARAYPYPKGLQTELRAIIADPARAADGALADVEAAVTDAHAGAVRQFVADEGIGRQGIDIIGFHGQTVFHAPQRRLTRQLLDASRAAAGLGVDVVSRFRHADVAAGGQGAPFVPLYHRALAHALAQPLIVLNLGGVANITYIDGETVIACDTGPASALLDDFVMQRLGQTMDRDGALAAAGTIDRGVLDSLMDHPFFAEPPPKSLDRNAFHSRVASRLDALADRDGAATLAAFTVEATAAILPHLPHKPVRWLVTGGGRLNGTLMRMFAARLAVPVEPVEAVGWNGDALEAQCFAWLAVRSLRGLPLSLPSTTGVPHPMPGGELTRARGA